MTHSLPASRPLSTPLGGTAYVAALAGIPLLFLFPLQRWFAQTGGRWLYLLLVSFFLSFLLVRPVRALAWRLSALRGWRSSRGLLAAGSPERLARLEHWVPLLLVDRGRDVARSAVPVLWPSRAWLAARYGATAATLPGQYLAHCRRLGTVLGRLT